MVRNDLDNIDEITAGSMALTSAICAGFKEYGSIKDMPSLKNEAGVLSVAGFSKTLSNIPMMKPGKPHEIKEKQDNG